MPTTNKSFEQPIAGSTNWDVPLNANFGYIDTALGGVTTKSVTGVGATPVVLTAAEYRSLILNFTGTLTANVTYQVPSGVGGEWIVSNNATGAFTLTIDNVAAGTSFVVPAGGKRLVYSDGTNINEVGSTGSVTSVAVSGGTTGLTTSGGPITSSGTITLAGTLAVANGGTGGTTQATARTGLGLGTISTQAASAVAITGGTMSGVTVSGGVITSGTAVATTSGSSVTFTGIPSWAKRITVMFAQVSAAADINFLVRIGDGAITTSGYVSTAMAMSGSNATNSANDSSGFVIFSPGAPGGLVGHMVLTLITANTWVSSHTGIVDTSNGRFGGGVKSLTGALDRVSLVLNGATTFDGGTVNIMYEG